MKNKQSKTKSNRGTTVAKVISALIMLFAFIGVLYIAPTLAPKPIFVQNFEALNCRRTLATENAVTTTYFDCPLANRKVYFRNVFVPNTEHEIDDNMRGTLKIDSKYQYTFRIRENEAKWFPMVLCLVKTFHRLDANDTISSIGGSLQYYYNEQLKDWLPYLYVDEITI